MTERPGPRAVRPSTRRVGMRAQGYVDLSGLGGSSLRLPVRLPRWIPRRSRPAAYVIAIVSPVLIALVSMPFRPSFMLAGILFCTLLAVLGVAVIGGVWPALLTVVVGLLAAAFILAPPYGSVRVGRPGDIVALVGFAVVGVVIGILVDDITQLAQEQAALRRVATVAARATTPDELFAAVTEAVGQRLPADLTRMLRYEPDGTATVVAGWSRAGFPASNHPRLAIGGRNVSTFVRQTSRPARLDDYADASGALGDEARSHGFRSSVGSPIIVEGGLWGVMMAASTRAKAMPARTEERLADLTDLVATAIANAESRADLAASRARIVTAADETRRRLERDLHDGAQQRLVSLALDLRAAQAAVRPEQVELEAELSRAADGLTSVLNELRELAHGIHPAILTEGGLGPALKALARRCPIPVELDVRTDARLPERVEVAAYYVVSETLTNAAKYAQASVVKIDVEAFDRVLRLSVRDDGVGGADPARGTGLIGLKDRIEAQGGTSSVYSPLFEGTTLRVDLPLDN
jgi:signal transduction histidine kinase